MALLLLFQLLFFLCGNVLATQKNPNEWLTRPLAPDKLHNWNSTKLSNVISNPNNLLFEVVDKNDFDSRFFAINSLNQAKMRVKRRKKNGRKEGIEKEKKVFKSTTDGIAKAYKKAEDFVKPFNTARDTAETVDYIKNLFSSSENPHGSTKSSLNDFSNKGNYIPSGQSQSLNSIAGMKKRHVYQNNVAKSNAYNAREDIDRGVNSIISNSNRGFANVNKNLQNGFTYMGHRFDNLEGLHGQSHSMLDRNLAEIQSGFAENRGLHGQTHSMLDRNLAEMQSGFAENRGLHGQTHSMLAGGFAENRGLHGQTHSMLDRNLAAMQSGFAMLGYGVDRNYEAIVHGTIQMHQQFACTQALINQGRYENAKNFEVTQGLINDGRIENALNFALTQDLINDGRVENAINFQTTFYFLKKAREENKHGFSVLTKIGSSNFEEILRSRIEAQYRFELVNKLIDRNYQSLIEGRREAGAYFNATIDSIEKGRVENWKYFNTTFNFLQQFYNESMRQTELAHLDRYAYYMSTINLINATRAELIQEFSEVKENIAQLSEQTRKGFEEVTQIIRQSNVWPILSKLVTFIEYFNDESKHIERLNKNDLFNKLKDEHGSLYYLTKVRTPQQTDSLHSLLNDIITQSLAIPKNETDQIALTALDFLCYGVSVYIGVMQFVLNGQAFLVNEFYATRDLDNYNKFHSKFIITFDEFHKSIGGSKTGLIDKTSEILKQIQKYPQMTERANHISNALQELKMMLDDLSTKLPRDVPSKLHIILDFDNSQLQTPIGEWNSGKKISYAMQFVEKNLVTQIGPWSTPYTINDKANPQFLVPPIYKSNATTIFIFRRFDQQTPELIGNLKSGHHAQHFHDINRDLYNAAGMTNKKMAFSLITNLLDNGANKSETFENGESAIHAAAQTLNIEFIKILIENSTDAINKGDAEENSPLHLAITSNYYDQFIYQAVNDLIELGADVNAKNYHGMFPLLIATGRNKTAFVERLLQTSNIDPNQQYISNMTALHFAAQNGQKEIVTYLLNHSLTNQDTRTFEQFTPLHLATIYGQLETMKILCSSQKVDVNAKANEMMTPLHFAALIGNKTLVSILLNETNSINVNSRTTNGITPLHFASGAGNLEVLRQLISHKNIDLNAKTTNGWTPLHFAIALRQNQTAMELLLKETIKINERAIDTNLTPLHLASLNSMSKVVKRLFQRSAETNIQDKRKFTALHYASMFSDDYILKKLLNFDEEIDAVDENNLTPLHVAVMYQNLKAIKFLLNQQPTANVNAKTSTGQTVIHLASALNNVSIINELIEKNAKIDELDNKNFSPLYLALKYNNLDAAHVLMKKSTLNGGYLSKNMRLLEIAVLNNDTAQILQSIEILNVTDEKELNAQELSVLFTNKNISNEDPVNVEMTLIKKAMKNFDNKTFDLLLKKLNVNNWRDDDQQNLLHIAAKNGNFGAAQALINKDSRLINTVNKNHWYPLHLAAWNGKCDIVSLLLNKGADVNAKSKYTTDTKSTLPSVSALHWSARANHIECVRILLNNGANINQKSHIGYTSLHSAAYEGHYEIVKLLVEKGANTSLETNYNFTALDISALSEKKNNEIVKYLASHTTYPVHSAVLFNNLKTLNALIDAGVNIYTNDDNQETPLHIAAKNGNFGAAQALINKDSRLINTVNKNHWYPLHLAAFHGKCDIVSLLLNKGADVNAKSKYTDDTESTLPSVPALHWAARANHIECVRILLNNGANVNQKSHNGYTALHRAADKGHYEIVKLLVSKGATN